MKRILAIAFAVVAVTIMTDSSANAQNCNSSGFGFGVGINQSFRRGGFEQPPYFARFPPVYYSHIVRRPYGISPYAAPAGIAPVELSIPVPTTVKNKFFNSNVAPVSDQVEIEETISDLDHKTTTAWVSNPFIESLAAN